MGKKPKKILIMRLGAIGDVVHTTIIAQAIKKSHPDWIIDYLTQSEIAPILENNPYIDNIHKWDTSKRKSIKYLMSTGIELLKQRYDVVFCLTYAIRNFLLSIMSFPKQIVLRKYTKGLWVEDFFESAKSIFPEIKKPKTLCLVPNKKQLLEVKERLKKYPKPHIMFIAGGDTDSHRQGRIWNIDKWKELSEELLKIYGGTIFVCGSKWEKKYHQILENDNVVITSGDYSLSGTSALLSQADIVISGDTGTLHIASAHNVKTLALLGSTSPDKIKPYGENGHYISANTGCKYCWQKKCKYLKNGGKYTPCMENITVSMVLDKVKEIFD